LWGHDDLAEGFGEDFSVVAGDEGERLMELWSGNQLSYPGRTLDNGETSEVLQYIDFIQKRT
jgi:hypothetical protein